MSAPPPPPPGAPEGLASSSLITPGLTSSLHGSGTFGASRGFGSAFNYGPAPAMSGYSTSSPGEAATPGTPPTARGDRRSRLVRERSRSSAAFSSSLVGSRAAATASGPSPGTRQAGGNAHLSAASPTPRGDSGDGKLTAAKSSDGKEILAAAAGGCPAEEAPVLFTSLCYEGMEVVFVAVHGSPCHLLGIHARTRAPFQKCHVDDPRDVQFSSQKSPSPSKASNRAHRPRLEIVQLASHPSTGRVYAADSLGSVHSFRPVRADPLAEAYGKFRWVRGSVARCRGVFGYAPLQAPIPARAGGASGEVVRGAGTLDPFRKESAVLPNVSMEITETGLEVEVEDGLMILDRMDRDDKKGGGVDELVGGTGDTFSIDRRMASSSIEEDAGRGQVCFYRRKRSDRSHARLMSPGGSTESNESLQSHYPLTDGQPPLPPTTLSYSADNDEVAGGDKERYGVMVCASMTERRVLVVHKDQLAVFDFSPPPKAPAASQDSNASDMNAPLEALLLWTHRLQGSIVDHASFSGDGRAVALALRGEGMGVPYPFGVRTFVRDDDDGSCGVAGGGGGGGKARGEDRMAAKGRGAGTPTRSGGGKPPVHSRTASGMKALPNHQSPPLPLDKGKNNFDGVLENVFGDKGGDAAKKSNGGPTAAPPPAAATRGILYKPHQFLVHSAPVTRLAFRGRGASTSSERHNCGRAGTGDEVEEEGNDLLLTQCASDGSVRIFSQNSWRQLMHWNSPPRSRADWVRGITAVNLGDLDEGDGGAVGERKECDGGRRPAAVPKDAGLSQAPNPLSSALRSTGGPSDGGSISSATSSDAGGINRALLATKNHRPVPSAPGAFPSQSVPGTHAGAWIAELTFRNAFPALRLSRLSYMKTGGDDALPAHFESVAAILPPGSLMEEVVLDSEGEGLMGCGEYRMEVEGIWPAWDPWEPGPKGKGGGVGGGSNFKEASADGRDGTLNSGPLSSNNPLGSPLGGSGRGSPSANAVPRWLGDGMSDLGGSHTPPSELRITSSSRSMRSFSVQSCLTQIEMPLWGDKDFGAMEFGAPMRYVMMMPETLKDGVVYPGRKIESPSAFLEYESGSRLCAQASSSSDGREHTIDLCWRRHGAVNLEEITESSNSLRRFQDLSLTPLPLSLPSLTLPKFRHTPSRANSTTLEHATPEAPTLPMTSNFKDKHAVARLHWWPDENFGGPPRLVVVTLGGTIIVYEMPPPWSALEPPMPSYDPFFDSSESRGSSVDSDFEPEFDILSQDNEIMIDPSMDSTRSFGEGSGRTASRAEYEVCISPHPDFGLGLRLEAQAVGMPAVAGSFKKHPLSGGRLPAERSGIIALGDELLAVNDVGLEGMPFEEAIATVRQIGFDSCGAPLRMRFRRGRGKRGSLLSSLGSGTRRSRTHTVDSRGTQGVVLEGVSTMATPGGKALGEDADLATVEVGADAEIQQGFGRIIAIVKDAVSVASDPPNGEQATVSAFPLPAMLLLPWNFGKGATVSHRMYGGALILWAVPAADFGGGNERNIIKAARLEAVLDIDPENARFLEMGSVALEDEEKGSTRRSAVKSISYISSTENGWLVAIHDCAGNVSLLFVETTVADGTGNFDSTSPSGASNLRATFRHYPSIFNTCGKENVGEINNSKHDGGCFLLRSFSLELFGGMKRCNGKCKELTIWSALPQSKHQSMHTSDKGTQFPEYHQTTISIDDDPQLSADEWILDFQWVSSGYVVAFPWLVVFTTGAAVVYNRSAMQYRWQPAAVLLYKEKLFGSIGVINPQDAFPHLISGLRCAGLSNDEHTGVVKSDWHPESILANICTEEHGAALALRSYVQGLYSWLSRWMSPDESMRPVWEGHGPLSSAPFRIVSDKTVLIEDESDERDDEVAETSASLFMAAPANTVEKPQSEEEVFLTKLQRALLPTIDTQSNKENEPDKVNGIAKRSREFLLAMSYARTEAKNQSGEDNIKPCPLPLPLQNLNDDERRCLWAIGDIMLSKKSPSLKKLDPLAQLCLFSVLLMRRLLDSEKQTKSRKEEFVNSMPNYEGGRPAMPAKQASTRNMFGQAKLSFDCVASAALLSALMSDSQAKLINSCRPNKGEKFSWELARSIGVPYWVRSNKLLIQIAEEIAQTLYKSTKDVMDCALYYVAMRNMTKLRAIAATDRSNQGKKFLKFIMDHDFASERGRQTAEKNAYSLLRKRKYSSAACFFLLAEPPMIKTALDVIKLQLQDHSLAFFVARLVEGAPKRAPDSGENLTIGGGLSLSSMGGGGGFAVGGGFVGSSGIIRGMGSEEDATVKFDCWKPTLGKSARSVLLPKDNSEGKKDVCFESLQLIWLGRPKEATLRLSHMSTVSICDDADDNAVASGDLAFPPTFGAPLSTPPSVDEIAAGENSQILEKSNRIINFCAGPSLLKKMKPKRRILLTSALLVSRALSRCGMEIPSMRILTQVADPTYEEEEEDGSAYSGSQQSKEAQSSNTPTSSIFDSYDAPTRPKPAAPKRAGAISSSIFDSFDAAPPMSAPKQPQSDPKLSSIFDSFDAAPPKPKPAPPKQPQSDPTASSIFDSFDTAPPKPKPAAAKLTQSDPMSSSIFDSFDAAPPRAKLAAPKPTRSDPMSSSIFDSFDTAPPKPKPAAPKPTQTDPMSSSIFDSFDTAPPKPKPAAPKQTQSDPMSSSMFDSFGAAPPKPKPAAPKPMQSDPMSSSIFDSFDAAPLKPKQLVPKQAPSGSMSPSMRQPNPTAHPTSKVRTEATQEVEKEQPLNIPSCPTLWNEWRQRLIHVAAARRFLRELARIISNFEGEPSYVPIEDFAQRSHPIIPTGAAEVLHHSCDSEGLLDSIFKSLSELNNSFGIDETVIIQQALGLLCASRQPKRLVCAVLLQCLLGRGDLAEDLVRDTASFQMSSSEFLGFSNDTIVDDRHTRYYTSSLWSRRESSSVIWQLELCLWLNRGGAFDMSAIAVKETLLAVRVGLAAVAWGRCHNSLDTLIKAEPDCLTDFDAGKNLWRSMKIIVANENVVDGIDGVTSGGWEFLVDCRREEATEMLRDGKTGQFLIRPHPQDPGVFTLSFKTNLIPTEPTSKINYDEAGTLDKPQETSQTSVKPKKVVKRDDVVQHAIIRLSDSGFRCGSFGPFATLVKLLHAVSDSLPFDLRFSDPPIKGIISEKGTQASPNSFLFRKLALHHKAQYFQFQSSRNMGIKVTEIDDWIEKDADDSSNDSQVNIRRRFGLLSQLMFLTELRKQLCAVAAAAEDYPDMGFSPHETVTDVPIDDDFDGSITEGSLEVDAVEEALSVASRMVKPLLNWVRSREIDIVNEVTPPISHLEERLSSVDISGANNEAEGDEVQVSSTSTRGDSMIRRMIQGGSGVEFRTLRVGEASNSVIVVLFARQDAIKWLMSNETQNDEAEAKARLKLMEMMRVIEPITFSDLSIPKSYVASHPSTESRYRFVDPWEVEALESRSGETASAALGRGRYQSLSVGLIASSCEKIVRAAGGLHLLGLWSTLKGGITLTKALCSAHPPWERDAGGDLLMKKGFLMEPSPYDNSIRQHLYGNYLFRRLGLPQRFLALVQVELLDLKNVTSPSGSSSLTAYALLRLKRQGSSAPLNHKARSLDSACTHARKISKSSGPNAPASWGSLVRFRFPLPEEVNCEGRSFDTDRESLFKGPPTCLQITVYEKKFMSDVELGGADVNMESLGSGGQIEEWVPLRAGKDGITWFARIRLSLRFELLCLESSLDALETGKKERCLSVGLKKISKLSRLGGAHEDNKQGMKNSMSTPDFGLFGNMLY